LEKIFSSREVKKPSWIIGIYDHIRSLRLKVPIKKNTPMGHCSILWLYIPDIGNRHGDPCNDIQRATILILRRRSGTKVSQNISTET
jgi:hypothetical protein